MFQTLSIYPKIINRLHVWKIIIIIPATNEFQRANKWRRKNCTIELEYSHFKGLISLLLMISRQIIMHRESNYQYFLTIHLESLRNWTPCKIINNRNVHRLLTPDKWRQQFTKLELKQFKISNRTRHLSLIVIKSKISTNLKENLIKMLLINTHRLAIHFVQRTLTR